MTVPNWLNYFSTALGFPHFVSTRKLKIITALNINKTYGYNDISLEMIKLCSKSVVKPLSMIINNCIDTGTFLDIWKI